MFGTKTITICAFTHTNVVVTIYSISGKGFKVKERMEKTCTPSEYKAVFQALRERYHVNTVRILLPEEDTYLKLLTFPKGTILTRALILEQAKELIPETIVDGYIDWKQVKTDRDELFVQLFVVKKEFLAPILSAASSVGVRVEACEPPSFAMARVASHVNEPFILVYPSVHPQNICAIQGGKVMEVVSLTTEGDVEKTKQAFITYVARVWGVTVKAIATNTPDPALGLAMKSDLSGEDINVLKIPSDTEHQNMPITKKHITPILIAALVAFIVIGMFLGYQFVLKKPSSRPKSSPPIQEIVPTPTIQSVDRTQLKLEVQNGSGTSGVAGKGKTALEDAGYVSVGTGNADTFDYTGITVRGKSAAITSFVLADVKKIYPSATASAMTLDTSSTLDAIVIIGKE